MPKGLQHKGIIRRNKMLYAAVQLFLENGYEKTTTASIAKAAGMAPSSFFAAFENKEALLLTLVKTMFGSQFETTVYFCRIYGNCRVERLLRNGHCLGRDHQGVHGKEMRFVFYYGR